MFENLSARIIGIIVAVVVAVAVVWAAFHFWEKSRSQGAQHRLEQGQAGAFSNSAADAINTVGQSSQREADTEALTRENERNIRAAEGADAPVADTATAAGRAAYCKREAYRNKPFCKEQAK